MAYFRYYPKIVYDIRGVEGVEQRDMVTNILARVLVKCHGWADVDGSSHEALVATCEFEKHIIVDGEKPEILAHKFYGDSELHWMILYANGSRMLNPYYDWPMTNFDLQKFVAKKYDDINATHHYEDSAGYEVDSTAPTATVITNFKHEEAVNDAKRVIRIIQPRYVSLVVDEFQRLMATQ
jgi:hypothetical protein